MPKRSASKASSASTSNCRRSERLSNRIKSMAKGQLASSKGQPSTSKENPRKRRRVMKMDEVNERATRIGLEEQEDFSTPIKNILEELSPDLEISEEALADMNTYLNRVLMILARQSAIFPLGRNSVCVTIKDVETAVPHVMPGDLGKYCVAEGRRAVKKWNELEYAAAYQ